MDAEALATALLPDPANPFSQSGADFFFRESARTLIVGLLDIVRTGDPADIPKLLGLPRAKLKEAFRGIACRSADRSGCTRAGRRNRRDRVQRDQGISSSAARIRPAVERGRMGGIP